MFKEREIDDRKHHGKKEMGRLGKHLNLNQNLQSIKQMQSKADDCRACLLRAIHLEFRRRNFFKKRISDKICKESPRDRGLTKGDIIE